MIETYYELVDMINNSEIKSEIKKSLASIYEDKEKNILTSNVIYLLEDTSYNDYNTMKSSFVSNNYIYYDIFIYGENIILKGC